jgi:hypothetical protein
VSELVTIVITCHNYGRFLAEAIESALAQTHADCEVVVVDDGSTDDSLEVASRYSDRVRVIAQERSGVERACNHAIAESSGEYVARLDADDLFEPTYVDELLARLRRTPEAAYAYCRPRKFGAESGLHRTFSFSALVMVLRTNFVNGSALTRRADLLGAGGYSEDLGEHANEDWDLWLKLLERGRRGTYVAKPLLRWRRHAGGSRNPEHGARLDASVEHIRTRHAALYSAVDNRRGRVAYALDLAVAVADLAFGLSRSERLARLLEHRSWRRFQRLQAPRAALGSDDAER